MQNMNKNQKIAFVTIAIIIILGISYYIYASGKESEMNFSELENIENQTEEETQNTIKVHVSGAVNSPGVVELEENSRVGDAIEKAGGVTGEASTDTINLAGLLEDGIKIHIPTKQEMEQAKLAEGTQETQNESTNMIADTTTGSLTNSSANSSSKTTSKVNINTATQTELETLPGIGPATATKIIEYREENGKFKSIEEIKEVNGIGDSKYDKIKDLIKV